MVCLLLADTDTHFSQMYGSEFRCWHHRFACVVLENPAKWFSELVGCTSGFSSSINAQAPVLLHLCQPLLLSILKFLIILDYFNLHFLENWWLYGAFFHVCLFLFRKGPVQAICPFLLDLFFISDLWELFIYSGQGSFVSYMCVINISSLSVAFFLLY